MDDCVFCKIAKGDLPAVVIDETPNTLAFLNIAPATRGHALVIPKVHAPNIESISRRDMGFLSEAVRRLSGQMSQKEGVDGLTVLQANGKAGWQTVSHVHFHLIPRQLADGLVLPRSKDAVLSQAELREVRDDMWPESVCQDPGKSIRSVAGSPRRLGDFRPLRPGRPLSPSTEPHL